MSLNNIHFNNKIEVLKLNIMGSLFYISAWSAKKCVKQLPVTNNCQETGQGYWTMYFIRDKALQYIILPF